MKKCEKGDSCGATCISRGKVCKKPLAEKVGTFLDKKLLKKGVTPVTGNSVSSTDEDILGLEKSSGMKTPFDRKKRNALTRIIKKKGLMGENEDISQTLQSISDFSNRIDSEKLKEADRNGTPNKKLDLIYRNFLNNDNFPVFDGEIYRGMSFKDRNNEFFQAKTGGFLKLDSLSSSTSSKEIAQFYGEDDNGVILVIKGNTRGKSIMPFTSVRWEKEILLPKGVKYEVQGVTDSNGVRTLELKEVS